MPRAHGILRKMATELAEPVRYTLPVGEARIGLDRLLGRRLRLEASGRIFCIHCGRKTGKSFNQGYCYPCFRSLARCDTCIVRPERCHHAAGTCREPGWAQEHCLRDHVVYLANTSGPKVGITRAAQLPTRWMDQGAVQALPLFRVRDRHVSGLVEVALKSAAADRTDWRRMLGGPPPALDMAAEARRILDACAGALEQVAGRCGAGAVQPLADTQEVEIRYPVQRYPDRVTGLRLDKTPRVEGTLLGIKGQYLILDRGVLNVRAHAGYEVAFDH